MISKSWWTRSKYLLTAPLFALTVVGVSLVGVGCAPTPTFRGEDMPTQYQQQIPQLVGNWEKITRSTCSEIYPDILRFQPGGLYSGHQNKPGVFTQWDVGTFEIISSKQIKISTANDAIITYEFSVLNNTLTFRDPDGCEYQYRRIA